MASIQGIYVALFGRPADPAGLAFFNEATNNGANLTAIGDLAATAEYQSRFAGMTNEQIVNSIYQSLFERDGEKAGVDFYVGELAAGRLNINNIAIAILDGAKNDDLATVNAKIAAADIFTSHLDLNAEIAAYSGNTAAGVGRDFLDLITKDNPGTEAGADAAILKLFPDQGQQPGGGGGGGGGGGSTFDIHNSEAGISFGGTAKGDITLGQTVLTAVEKSVGGTLTGERGTVQAKFSPNEPIQTWDGVHIASKALDVLAATESLKLANHLSVSLDAATASSHSITGEGYVRVDGSEGVQDIHVSVTDGSDIAGGLGADTIDITGSTGEDTIHINGVDSGLVQAVDNLESQISQHDSQHEQLVDAENTALDELNADREGEGHSDEDVFQAQANAQAAFNEIGGDEGLAGLDQAKIDTAQVLADRQELETAKITTYDKQTEAYQDEAKAYQAWDTASKHNASVSTYSSAGISDNITNGFLSGGSAIGVVNITTAKLKIDTLSVDQALKDLLKAALPTQGSAFNETSEQLAYKAAAAAIIETYKSGVATEAATKLDALTTAQEDSDKAHDTYVAAKNALDQHTSAHGSSADVAADAQSAAEDAAHGHQLKSDLDTANGAAEHRQDLIDTYDHAHQNVSASNDTGESLQTQLTNAKDAVAHADHDSMLGHEDHIVGFELGNDVLHLPSDGVISNTSLSYNVGEATYHISVTNGIATITEGGNAVAVNSTLMQTAYDLLSRDDVIANGESVAFLYDEDNNGTADGLYVFQGGDHGSDIGVKLVGITNTGSLDLNQVFHHSYNPA